MSPSRFVANVLFPCPQPSYTIDSFPGELIWVPPGAGVSPLAAEKGSAPETVPCLLLPYESARFLVIFFHSNAEDLGRCRWFCCFLREQFQVHVLAVEYPGYGVCAGPASPEGVIANALAGLQFATQALRLPLERIKVFGRSIGTGPALYLASRYRLSGVILVTPFSSIKRLFRDRVGPLAALVEEWFQNDEEILRVESPTLFIHGKKDAIIPCHHTEALYSACMARKLFINPSHMEHNANLTVDASLLIVPMFRFFSLPDYSFEELQVPPWAFDKRRSSLYVRPLIEVCSHSTVPAKVVPGGGGMAVPAGDDEEEAPVNVDDGKLPATSGAAEVLALRKIAAQSPPTILTHPTVLHAYKATKQQYDFGAGARVDAELEEGLREMGTAEPLQLRPLGDRASASTPLSAARCTGRTFASRQRRFSSPGGPGRPPGSFSRRGASRGCALPAKVHSLIEPLDIAALSI